MDAAGSGIEFAFRREFNAAPRPMTPATIAPPGIKEMPAAAAPNPCPVVTLFRRDPRARTAADVFLIRFTDLTGKSI